MIEEIKKIDFGNPIDLTNCDDIDTRNLVKWFDGYKTFSQLDSDDEIEITNLFISILKSKFLNYDEKMSFIEYLMNMINVEVGESV